MCMPIVTESVFSFTQLRLISFQFLLIFKIFNCISEIHYRIEAVVYQNILKVTVQHTALNPMQCFVSILREITQAIAQLSESCH